MSDPGIQFLAARSRKRPHSQMSQTSRTPSQSSRPQVVDIASPSASPPQRRRPLTLPSAMRFPGDGFDFRRPVLSSSQNNTGSAEDVIDLTDEPDPAPSRATEQNESPSLSPRQTRLPRFGREIMDVVDLADDDEEEEAPSSPEVEFVGASTRRPATAATSTGISAQASHLYHMLVSGQQSFARQIPWAGRLLRRPPQDVDTVWIGDGAEGGMGFSINVDVDYPQSTPVQVRPENTYKPPSPPPEGFTRSVGEDDVVVCPNCDEELGMGDEVKQQIFVVKHCGHVYCGECARHRSVSKAKQTGERVKPFSKCKVLGCEKPVSAPRSMLQVYL